MTGIWGCPVVRFESAGIDPVARVAIVSYLFIKSAECTLETRQSISTLIISAYQLDHLQFSSTMQSPFMPCCIQVRRTIWLSLQKSRTARFPETAKSAWQTHQGQEIVQSKWENALRCGRPEVQALFRSWCKGGEDGRRDKARRSAPWSYLSVHRQLICSADPNLWKIRDLLALIEVGNDSATLLMPVNYNIRLRPRWIVSWEHFAKPACLKVSCVSLMIQSNLSDSFFLANCSIRI